MIPWRKIDVKKERIILRNMFKLLKDKTVIIVSHRFNNEDLFNQKIILGDYHEYWFWEY